jgi:hypothetical protein
MDQIWYKNKIKPNDEEQNWRKKSIKKHKKDKKKSKK